MLPKFILLLFLLLVSRSNRIECEDPGFIYNNFKNASSLVLDGVANITDGGLLRLTGIDILSSGHAFHYKPFVFKNSSNNTGLSFSTTFVFAIVPKYDRFLRSGHGFTFVVSPTSRLKNPQPMYLGLFNRINNGNSSNNIVAVEFDTVKNPFLGDINDNHVGIDINGLPSVQSAPASYVAGDSKVKNLTLKSGDRMQVWIDYDGLEKLLNVTISPIYVPRPKIPLLSLSQDISPVLMKSMYVGFSASTGRSSQSPHFILGWSFKMNGYAQELDLRSLPMLPKLKPESRPQDQSRILKIGLPVAFSVFVLLMVLGILFLVRRKYRYTEVLEDWEKNYGPHRFSYKDLYVATKGFKEKELLGKGGFGRVYRGVLPRSNVQVAVKRISHESRQGIKEFVAEIVTLGQLKHRNLVQLLGYCRRKGELLLVYDYMPNGSLEKFLFSPQKSRLSWGQRFVIIKGVASGLVYLHEEWDQVVIHRDIKASNVLLDVDFTGKLSDFGLARLYDHGTNPQTTNPAGTFGYLAPEMARNGKATMATDVYSFGAFVLEVACGRRPIEVLESSGNINLVDWVINSWRKGEILVTADPKLGGEYVKEEMELVLKLGLLCSQIKPSARPTMRQILQCLENEYSLHDLSHELLAFGDDEESSDFPLEIMDSMLTSVATHSSHVVVDSYRCPESRSDSSDRVV